MHNLRIGLTRKFAGEPLFSNNEQSPNSISKDP